MAAVAAALLLVGAATFYVVRGRNSIPSARVLGPTRTPSPTPVRASSPRAGPAAVEPSDTPPPGVAGDYGLEFQLKLVQNVDSRDTFRISFHPPNSAPGYEATFTFCPPQSDNGFTGPGGPCRAGTTYVEGGGFQPAGSSMTYVFTRTSASGTSQVIAQGVTKLNMNEALVVVYPPSS